jgi:hypothetical protein
MICRKTGILRRSEYTESNRFYCTECDRGNSFDFIIGPWKIEQVLKNGLMRGTRWRITELLLKNFISDCEQHR